MAELQRSATTFRRSGSSGLVWDERFLSRDGDADAGGELRRSRTVGPTTDRCRDDNDGGRGGGRQAFRANAVPAAADPPSPDAHCGGLCGIFGKAKRHHRSKPRRR
ncbi:MAPK kinase substrate protein At1g80180-like [Curcuma longa]|uniref:MAPK kinase substrate protein At1g80180-like n=1 Tax=Curcuma longa TaxID=136217 RepID=UPI003D9ED076